MACESQRGQIVRVTTFLNDCSADVKPNDTLLGRPVSHMKNVDHDSVEIVKCVLPNLDPESNQRVCGIITLVEVDHQGSAKKRWQALWPQSQPNATPLAKQQQCNDHQRKCNIT